MTDKEIKYWKISSIVLITIGIVLCCIGYFVAKSKENFGLFLMFLGAVGFLVTGLPILGRVIDEQGIHRLEKDVPNHRRR